jgi:DNA transposition AAA+ family ATPase
MTTREEAREALQAYLGRTGLSVGQVAMRIGYGRHNLLQFMSKAKYGDGDGSKAAGLIMEFIKANPLESPALPGKLYATRDVKLIDRQLAYVKRGHWALLNGPPGTQKTFTLDTRMAEQYNGGVEPGVVVITPLPGVRPLALLQEIAIGLGAYVGQNKTSILRSILYTLRRRKAPLALCVDEAQGLAGQLDTLETLRRVADLGRIGLLVAGHDNVEDVLLAPRPDNQLEQWKSRIEQHISYLPGLNEDEARLAIAGEAGELPEGAIKKFIADATVEHRRTRQGRFEKLNYISARRLFNSLRDFTEKRGNGKVN